MGIGNGQVFYRWVSLGLFSMASFLGNRVALGVSCSDVFKAVTPIVAPAYLTSAHKWPGLQDWTLSESRHDISSYDRWKSVVEIYRAGLVATLNSKVSKRTWYQRFAAKDLREIRAELRRVNQMLKRGEKYRSLLSEPKLFDFFVILEVIQNPELRKNSLVWSFEELVSLAESVVNVDGGSLSDKIFLALRRYRIFFRSGLSHSEALSLTRESMKGRGVWETNPLKYVSGIQKMIGTVDRESMLILLPAYVEAGLSNGARIAVTADVREVQSQYPGFRGHLIAYLFENGLRTRNLFGLKARVLIAMEMAQAIFEKTGDQVGAMLLAKTGSEVLLGEVDRDLKFISAISEIFWRNRPKDSNPVHFALTEKGIRTLGRSHELRALLHRMSAIDRMTFPENVPFDVLLRVLE